MTELYGLYIPGREAELEELAAGLSPFRQAAAAGRRPAARTERLADGVCLDYALSRHGLREREMTYTLGLRGKPALADHPHLHFNLSHSGDWAVCALSDGPVGVDVERPGRRRLSVGERVCGAAELAWADGDAQRLLALWTAKESAVKCLGRGVGALRRVRVDPERWTADLDGTALYLARCPLAPYALTLASLGPAEPLTLIRVP